MSDDQSITKILELMASRICHDIISPVGAVNNGVEFLEEMGPDELEEGLSLISYSATQASAKLMAFRLAYGAGGADPNIKPEDIQKAFSSLIRGDGKVSQVWDPYGKLGPDPLPPGFCKMLMCCLMLAQEALPKGGSVSVKPGDDDDTLIIAEGENAGLRENTEEALNNSLAPDDVDPRLVHPFTVGMIGKLHNFTITVPEKSEGKVVFSLKSSAPAES